MKSVCLFGLVVPQLKNNPQCKSNNLALSPLLPLLLPPFLAHSILNSSYKEDKTELCLIWVFGANG
jgi:hypothetical protein